MSIALLCHRDWYCFIIDKSQQFTQWLGIVGWDLLVPDSKQSYDDFTASYAWSQKRYVSFNKCLTQSVTIGIIFDTTPVSKYFIQLLRRCAFPFNKVLIMSFTAARFSSCVYNDIYFLMNQQCNLQCECVISCGWFKATPRNSVSCISSVYLLSAIRHMKYSHQRKDKVSSKQSQTAFVISVSRLSLVAWLTHWGRVTHYGDGSMMCKNPIFSTMKEFP